MFTYDQIQTTEDTGLEDLSYAATSLQPQDASWEGYPETFEYFQSVRSDSYPDVEEGVLVYPGDQDLASHLFEECQGPMMNSVTELPPTWGSRPYQKFDSIEEAAAHLYDLPLCIVEFFGEKLFEYGLALTGGGMDFSWEVCEAYIRLGHLPPTHFARLPDMANRGNSERDRKIIAACKMSFRGQRDRAEQGLRDLEARFG